jgi:hypothetical protein
MTIQQFSLIILTDDTNRSLRHSHLTSKQAKYNISCEEMFHFPFLDVNLFSALIASSL